MNIEWISNVLRAVYRAHHRAYRCFRRCTSGCYSNWEKEREVNVADAV